MAKLVRLDLGGNLLQVSVSVCHCNQLVIRSLVIFQIVRCSPNLSTFIAIDLSSNHLWIFKLCVFRQYFDNYCNWLINESNVNFQVVGCSPNLSTYIAINLSSNHFWIFKWGVVRQIFPHSSQLTYTYLSIICEFSSCALSAKSFHNHCNWLIIHW